MELVPLRIKIGRKQSSKGMRNDYPDFNAIDSVIRHGLDWSNYVDTYGTRWHYDKLSGFKESDAYNPDPMIQYGMFAVPEDFANAALTLFPTKVEQLTEAEFETFYNDRAHSHESEEDCNSGVLNVIRAKYGDIPITKQKIIEFFTDVTKVEKDAKVVEFESLVGKGLTIEELAKIELLVKMSPADCKALDPNHPAPGIKKNRRRYYSDFKALQNFTVKK